jgi:type II secretory ATPase GspE/PulE/Tfp pilus assembly ATPase PilB-like protein
MGLEPFLVASALRLVMAQRLIRRLCRACKAPIPPDSDQARTLLRSPEAQAAGYQEGAVLYQPVGCPACAGTGYRGRTGIFEALWVSESVEDLIVARAGTSVIRDQARREGMRTLREAGWAKVLAGETSVAEVIEHTMGGETSESAESGYAVA